MASSTTDDFLILTVGDDNVVSAAPEHAPGTVRMHDPARRLLDRRTQQMALSASIKQRRVCGAHAGPSSIVLLAARTKDAFRPPAQW